jgi:hypothetical protein
MVGNPDRKRLSGRPGCRWNNIKIKYKKKVREFVLQDLCDSGCVSVATVIKICCIKRGGGGS